MSTFGNAESRQQSEPAAASGAPGRWSGFLLPPDFYPERTVDTQSWGEAIFEPVALIGSVVCFILSLVSFGLAIAPTWDTRFLILLSAVVGVEAFFYSRRLVRSVFVFREWLTLLVPPIVLARFLPYLEDPTASLSRDVASWWTDPGSFFTLAFVADVFVLLTVWWIVFVCTQCLNQLRVQEGEILEQVDSRFAELYEDNWRSYDHASPLRKLGQFYVWGGVTLVIMSAIASIGTAQLFSLDAIGQMIGFQRPSLHLVLANVLLYFVLGLLLLGEAHFVRQRTLWRLDRLSMPEEIASRWIGSVAGLVVVATVIAALLPTSYAMTLGDLISSVVAFAIEVFMYFAALIFYLIFLVSKLFPSSGGTSQQSAPTLPPHFPATAPPPTAASPLDAIKSLVFWLVAFGIVAYSLSVLWRRRGPWAGRIPMGRLLSMPLAIARWIIRLVKRVGREVGQAVAAVVPSLLRQASAKAPRSIQFISLSKLGPSELVEYFYLSICERAAQLGHPRPPGITPTEYRALLREALPTVDPELDALTDAFVEARYGPHPPSASRAQVVRAQWQTLKVKLRRLKVQRLRRRD